MAWRSAAPCMTAVIAAAQGLTLVHFSAQLKSFVWDRGCILALFRRWQGVLVDTGGVFCVQNGSG